MNWAWLESDELPRVLVYDNADLNGPFRLVASYEAGKSTPIVKPLPKWLSVLGE